MSIIVDIPNRTDLAISPAGDMGKVSLFSDPRIKEIFKKAMADLLMGTLCVAVTAPFVVAPIAIGVGAIGVLVQVVLSVAYRFLIVSAFSKEEEKELPSVIHYVPAILFAMCSFVQVGTLIHEMGHAATASLLFQGSSPTVTLNTFAGGVTQYGTSALTHLGGLLGFTNAHTLVVAAGPALLVSFSLAQMALSHFFKDSRPELSRYLQASAIFNIFTHVIYALSTFIPSVASDVGHDFTFLYRVGGIHPALAAITFISLPIILKLALHHLSSPPSTRVDLRSGLQAL